MTIPTPATLPNSADSDPRVLGWMTAFRRHGTVIFADGSFRRFPQLRWSWSNIRQVVPTVGVWRGPGPASVLPRAERDLGSVKLTTMDGRPITFGQALRRPMRMASRSCIAAALSLSATSAPSSRISSTLPCR